MILAAIAALAAAPSFGVHTLAVSHRGRVTVREISYAVDATTRERAYFLVPPGRGPHPAIVFVPGRRRTRRFFLREALADARAGVESLSLDDLSTGYPTFTARDRPVLERRVRMVRRAIELLASRRGVDPRRLGYVGHSDGAELGGIVAGLTHRIRAYALMCGGGVWDRATPAYDRLVAPLDADRFVAHAAPAALLFQNALYDQYVPRSDALEFQRLGSRPKLVRWYATRHFLDARAERDRQRWLARELGFRSPV